MTKDEIEVAVMAEYREKLGRVIYPTEVDGYCGCDQHIIDLWWSVPMVVEPSSDDEVCRWMDHESGDPVWNVGWVNQQDYADVLREYEFDEFVGLWVYAQSYQIGVGKTREPYPNTGGLKLNHRMQHAP